MFHVIIPARFAASRLPGKPLLMIGERPLIQWVWQRALASGAASVLVATDDERIRSAALKFGADCLMTSRHHASGTDRIAEVVRLRGFAPEDIVVNLQADEPMMPAEAVAGVAQALHDAPAIHIATAVAPIQSLAEFLDPNCVKALRANDGRALYFSRAPVPWPRDSVAADQPTRFADDRPVLMTEKDAVKCAKIAGAQHWYVPVSATFGAGESETLLGIVARNIQKRAAEA